MEYYAKTRFETEGESEGFGVTQPCQIQYIRYFEEILKNKINSPLVLSIRKLTFKGKHKYNNLYFKLKSFENNHTIVTTKKGKSNAIFESGENEMSYKFLEDIFWRNRIFFLIQRI